MAMKRTSLYLEEDHYAAIQAMAKEQNVPAARMIREACEVVMGVSLLTSYDLATVERLRQVYPRMHFAEIVRELMFQWRIKHEGKDTKDQRLSTVVEMLEDLKASDRESREILVQIREALGTTTTTTTTEKTVPEG
jgi:hypothetical protein